ncbi:threonine--tRNA ligase, partial [candidate division WWE3 bacterium RIFCSPLOWO2_02_FULL_53_10]
RAIWPGSQNAIGPAIENGFYQDFEIAGTVTDEDLPKIEAKIRELLPAWTHFEKKEVTEAEALKEFSWNTYKTELIHEFATGGKTITFHNAPGLIDLCKGGHTEHPNKDINPEAFKIVRIAGAYWRGDKNNKMLTRIYGLAFDTKQELEAYLTMLEEAKKRDHRKLGKELDLFSIRDEVGPGLVLWHPKGTIIKEELERWGKETERAWGYQRVSTPHITKADLFYTSGHLPYYKDDMYPPMKLDGDEEYFLKPMNCPHHHMVYSARPHSYRDLPLRYAEYGSVYRYEASGELFGLMRVRGMTQNDSHIYCTQEQAVDEFVNVMKLHEYYYKTLGVHEYHLELALRDPKNTKKYHGDESMWLLAEKLMREAVARTDIPMVEEIGSAAFYGPKIDFIIHSSIGREFAISTNQID